jgi:hypothetical protein
MYSLSPFGDDGAAKSAAPAPQPPKPAQGLFGAKCAKASTPPPRPEQFGRR